MRDTRIEAALRADWIEHRELCSSEEIDFFAQFSARLVKGERNLGEAAVLALARVTDGTAVIDDGAARKAAEDYRIKLRPTLALLCEAVQAGLLTVSLVSALADDLLAGQYRLPFRQGGFEKWACDNGVLPCPDQEGS